MSDTTQREIPHIFDLIFKRLLQEASPQAVIALINGLFEANFPPDSPVFFPNKEQVTEGLKKLSSDMMILIGSEVFHIEAQIDDDLNMALRMFRYGYHEAITNSRTGTDGSLSLTFPQARVVYFETSAKTPDNFTIHITFPDKSSHSYAIPTFKVLEHEVKELEQKKLALLLPFYILKYRQQVKTARNSAERQAIAPGMKAVMENLLNAVRELREMAILTANDETVILEEVKLLYASLYEPYEEFKEAKMTYEEFDKKYPNPFVKARREARAEGKAEGETVGMEKVARNALAEGATIEFVRKITGLDTGVLQSLQVGLAAT